LEAHFQLFERILYFCVHSKIFCALNLEAKDSSGAIYQITRRHVTEYLIFHNNGCKNPRCHNRTACRPNSDFLLTFLLCRSRI